MKSAIQLYSIRKTLMDDLAGNLAALRGMGYDGAEIYDLGADGVRLTADTMKKEGLEVFSCHINADNVLRADENETASFARLGIRYLVIGSFPAERLAGGPLYRETAEGGLAKRYGSGS